MYVCVVVCEYVVGDECWVGLCCVDVGWYELFL